jgi:preprotein translocase subunit SecG
MLMLPLAKISMMWTLFAALWTLLAVGLVLIILIQKGRGGGISAAFGGGGANSLLGTKTGDFLTWVTIGLVTVLLVGAVVMGKFMRPQGSSGLVPTTTIPMQPATLPGAGEADLAGQAGQAEQTAGEAAEQVPAAAEQAAEMTEQPAEQPAPVEN